jgi:amidase
VRDLKDVIVFTSCSIHYKYRSKWRTGTFPPPTHSQSTMASRTYPLIQTLPVPKGTDAFEAKRAEIFETFVEKVPEEYYIPQHYVDNPPKDVTSIPRDCGMLTAEELDITESYDATSLAEAIAARKYTAVAVATAFSKRAIICDQVSCCLSQWMPEMAQAQAKTLDEHLERTGKTVGPLHGVPISVKQHIPLAGTYSDIGFVSTRVFDEEDSPMIAIFRKLGAVFYVKTNQPQALMHLETDSHFGRVLNPYNIDLSAGGSTGGESALIALRGSVLGIGTDIGGSVRGPAGKCGIYGFKPTSYTFPMGGFVRGGFPAELNVLCSTGPLCNTLRDMDAYVRLTLEQKPHLTDPNLTPVPWTGLKTPMDVTVDRPLKIGVMMDDGVIQPQPPVRRALEWTVKQLETSPLFDLKPFKPYRAADAMSLIRKMYWPDGGKAVHKATEVTGEPIHFLTTYIMKDAEGPPLNVAEVTNLRIKRDDFRCQFAKDWTEQDVDVVLCPMFVGPAPAHDTSLYWNYTALWNILDCPGVVFPTPIKAGKKGSEQYASDASFGEKDDHVREMWATNDYEGAPIALQLVARKHYDNFLFGALDLMQGPLRLV